MFKAFYGMLPKRNAKGRKCKPRCIDVGRINVEYDQGEWMNVVSKVELNADKETSTIGRIPI